MVVRHPVHRDAVPPVLLDFYPGAVDPREGSDEMVTQPDREILDLADSVLAGEGVDGVFLRVRGEHVRIVAGQVRGGEVTTKRSGDVQIGDLVHRSVPRYGDVMK